MVTKLLSLYWGVHFVECYCKESIISGKNWQRYLFSSYLIKIWLSVWHQMANWHPLFKNLNISGTKRDTCAPSLLTTISPSVFFFLFRQDVDEFPCWTEDGSSCFDLSHILLLTCDARWRQAVFPPFPGNKTDGEKGCRLEIGTVPSWKKTCYFRSCKWVVPCRNCLGTVPKLWRAVPIF